MARQTETPQINMELVGFVTLSNQEREKPPSRVISSDRNGPRHALIAVARKARWV
jgi:hypothetical protein